MNKRYIGDGVYAEYDNYGVILTTKIGGEITNIIYLEAVVLNNLNEYLKDMFRTGQMSEKEKNEKV